MDIKEIRMALLGRCAVAALGAVVGLGWHGVAQAQSICTSDASEPAITFSCADAGDPATETAKATLSAGSSWGEDPAQAVIDVYNTNIDATLSLEGSQLSSVDGPVIAVRSIGGDVNYSSTATTSTTGGFNTILIGNSVTANTGEIIVDGSRGYGLYSIATGGNNVIEGGSTTVTGPLSIGLVAYATNGDVVINTGSVSALGYDSWAVYAETLSGTSCGSNTVNVTGDIISSHLGINAFGCAASTVNVQAGTSVTVTSTRASAIHNEAMTVATTNISGHVIALSPSDYVLESYAPSTVTTISSTGLLSGTVEFNDGNATMNLSPGAVWQTAGFNGFWGGNDALRNEGTIRLEYGSTSFGGLELFTNAGTIDLAGGAVGDTFFLSGDYVGELGATLIVDANATSADRLVIAGSASGTTALIVNGIGSILTTPVQIVEAGSLAAGAFVLGSTSATPLIDLRLVQQGTGYFVLAAPSTMSFQPMLVGPVAQDMWYQSADAYSAYAAQRRSDLGTDRKNGIGLWGQLYASSDRHGARETQLAFGTTVDIDNRVRSDRRGAQVGVDFLGGNSFVVGITGGYQHADADHRSQIGGVDAEGYNVGLYGQFGSATGFYVGALLKKDWNDVRLTSSAFDLADGSPDSTSTGIGGEAGYRWQGGSLSFDVGGGLTYVRTKIDGFTAEGIAFDFDRAKSLRGRLGARAGFGGSLAPFVDARLHHEFDGDNEMTLTSGIEVDTVNAPGRGTWGRLEAGIGSQGKPGLMLSGWIDVGDVRGAGLKAGLRF